MEALTGGWYDLRSLASTPQYHPLSPSGTVQGQTRAVNMLLELFYSLAIVLASCLTPGVVGSPLSLYR